MSNQSQHIAYTFGGIKVKHFMDNNSARISNVGYPTKNSDAATKKYVDDTVTAGVAPSQIEAGTGLTKVGTTLNINSSLTHVTALGNVNTGTWSANTISVPYGGTGKTTFTPNCFVVGNGTNPLITLSEITFDSNIFNVSSPIYISNTNTSTGIGSGGSLTVLGGASISGKIWTSNINVSNDIFIQGNLTVGNITINGSSSFNSISSNNASYTNVTATNSYITNITASSLVLTNVQTTNVTSTNIIATNLTNNNTLSTNISASSLNLSNSIKTINSQNINITTTNILSSQINTLNITTNNIIVTNITGSSAILSNLNITSNITAPTILSTNISSVQINSSHGSFLSISSNNLIVTTNTSLTNTTTSNLFNINLTSSNIKTTNIATTNITNTNIITSSITSNNLISTNISSNNVLSTNITVGNVISSNITVSNVIASSITTNNINTNNITNTNLFTENITASSLRISGISIQTTINSSNLSTGSLFVSGTTNLQNTSMTNITSINAIMTNTTVSNINNTNLTNTNITTTQLITNNLTTSNLHVNNTTILGTVASINLSTGNLSSTTLAQLNRATIISSTISNLNVPNISILGIVNSNNLSTGNIHVSNSLTVPILNNTTQTTTNLVTTHLKCTNISTANLQITNTALFSNVSTASLSATGTSNLNNVTATDIDATNLIISNITTTNNISASNLILSDNIIVDKHITIGSDTTYIPSTTSGNTLHIQPITFIDSNTPNNGIIPFWTNNYLSKPTLSANNTNIITQKSSNLYIQGNPEPGTNQTIENSAAIAIGYVDNETGGNMSGQIILERGDGNWYGSIFTESATNKIVIANASLAGGGGVGLYTYTGTKITLSDITSPTNFTPKTFVEFSNDTSTFYSTTDSTDTSSGSLILSGGLAVMKNITCNSITPNEINSSIKILQDVNTNMSPLSGQALIWNGSEWTATTISAGIGSGPTKVNVYPMNLVTPVMDSNGPVSGNDGDYYVTASSEFDSTYSAYKCMSNIKNPTDWSTLGETTNFWITVQLPQTQKVRYIALEGRINSEDPLFVTIQGSNDNLTFTNIYENKVFTALNYLGYFAARIPENSIDYTYYKFLFPSGSGVNPGLNMLRLFKYDNTTYSEGILDNSALEGNGNFNSAINNGKWPLAFELSESCTVNVKSQFTCTTSSLFILKKFIMYIDGAPFDNNGSTFIKQTIHQNLHIACQTLEWTGFLSSGIHTISFFVDGGSGIVFDTNDTIRVNVLKYT
jgi:hypothetical protein